MPFLAEVVGEPEIKLSITQPSILGRIGATSSEEPILMRFSLSDALKEGKPYVQRHTESGTNVVKLDLDSDEFLSDRRLYGSLINGESLNFLAKLSCEHEIEADIYYQPPLLNHEDKKNRKNLATRGKTTVIKQRVSGTLAN